MTPGGGGDGDSFLGNSSHLAGHILLVGLVLNLISFLETVDYKGVAGTLHK